MALQVSGKTALVTGGGSGICLEFTKLLLANNCNVLIADLQLLPEAETLVNSSTSTNGNAVNGAGKAKAVFQKTDLTDWGQLEKAFERVVTEFGSLELVVPGAGIFEPSWSNFWHPKTGVDSTSTNSYKTLEINITHPIRCTQLALQVFKRQAPAPSTTRHTVLHISSIAAQLPLIPIPLYACSKAALSSFIRSLAPLEPHSNIRISAVAPAIVETPMYVPEPHPPIQPTDTLPLGWSERRTWVDPKTDKWISPTRIASVMLDVVQNDEYVGGTILEVGLDTVRRVEGLGDPGPDMSVPGYSVGGIGDGVVGALEALGNFGK